MGDRRKSRELALQALYLIDLNKLDTELALRSIMPGKSVEDNVHDFTKDLTFGVKNHWDELNTVIQKVAANWEIDRMATLDRNILRLGAYEILYTPETPISVIIDEAVEMAKSFSTPESGKFVNGILDKIKSQRKSTTPNDSSETQEEKPAHN